VQAKEKKKIIDCINWEDKNQTQQSKVEKKKKKRKKKRNET